MSWERKTAILKHSRDSELAYDVARAELARTFRRL